MKWSWNKNFILFILFVLSCIYAISGIKGEIMIVRVFYYSFFFIFGCLFQMRNCRSSRKQYLLHWLTGITGGATYLLWEGIMPNLLRGIVRVLAAAFIINAAMGTAQKYYKRQNLWSFLGQRSLEIYTLHLFIISGIRPIFGFLHMENYWVNVIIATFLGISVPVFCSYILKRLNLWNLFYKPVGLLEKRCSWLK